MPSVVSLLWTSIVSENCSSKLIIMFKITKYSLIHISFVHNPTKIWYLMKSIKKKFYSEFAMLLKQSMFAGKDKLLLK